uniref:Kringle domain-containing protein n=1 Tax=Macrostomum lignano TaxID=282301 RepID=A0A1I8F220_9PLAT
MSSIKLIGTLLAPRPALGHQKRRLNCCRRNGKTTKLARQIRSTEGTTQYPPKDVNVSYTSYDDYCPNGYIAYNKYNTRTGVFDCKIRTAEICFALCDMVGGVNWDMTNPTDILDPVERENWYCRALPSYATRPCYYKSKKRSSWTCRPHGRRGLSGQGFEGFGNQVRLSADHLVPAGGLGDPGGVGQNELAGPLAQLSGAVQRSTSRIVSSSTSSTTTRLARLSSIWCWNIAWNTGDRADSTALCAGSSAPPMHSVRSACWPRSNSWPRSSARRHSGSRTDWALDWPARFSVSPTTDTCEKATMVLTMSDIVMIGPDNV